MTDRRAGQLGERAYLFDQSRFLNGPVNLDSRSVNS